MSELEEQIITMSTEELVQLHELITEELQIRRESITQFSDNLDD